MDGYKVYAHINKLNGKIYIGQTGQKNVKDRWDSGHGYKSCIVFNRAIKKYGWDNFKHIVLFDNLSLEMANIIEAELIKKYDATNSMYGYNITSGGMNYKMSDESKEKIRKSRLGTHNSESSKEKLKNTWKEKGHPFKGKHHSQEAKEKISLANTGKDKTEEEKKHMSDIFTGSGNPFYGKHHTDDSRKKISKSTKERLSKPENNPFYGKNHSEEAKKKISDAHKKITGEKHWAYGKPMSLKVQESIRQSHIKTVCQYDKQWNFIAEYESCVEAANVIGCSKSAISKCCTGINHTCKGYIFRYKEEVTKEIE